MPTKLTIETLQTSNTKDKLLIRLQSHYCGNQTEETFLLNLTSEALTQLASSLPKLLDGDTVPLLKLERSQCEATQKAEAPTDDTQLNPVKELILDSW